MPSETDEELLQNYDAERERTSQSHRRQIILSWGTVALVLVTAGILLWTVAHRQPRQVEGVVRCTSGAAVTGVWVKEARGSGGFAGFRADPGGPLSAVRYVFDVRGGRTYGVNVGCGGTTGSWRIETRSDYVAGSRNDFTCHDVSTDPLFRRCVHQP